jgi:Ca-activated chloride channel family protein
MLNRVHDGGGKSTDDSATRVIFIADLSPSMLLQDAGPEGTQTRADRARDVVDSILQRVGGDLRFGVIAFYTASLPVVMEARDPELVRNVFNGLPLRFAMPVGQTDLGQAVNAAFEHVVPFPEGSTRLVFVTDGDSVSLSPIAPRPKSVSEVIVLGVGNPKKGTYIDGHQSRQETDTLRRLATALDGRYEDVNEKQLATAALGDLVATLAPAQNGLTRGQLAALAMVLGALVHACAPLALERWGSEWKVERPAARKTAPAPGAMTGKPA